MSEEKIEDQAVDQKPPALAEVLIQTAVGIGKEQNMKLVERAGQNVIYTGENIYLDVAL